MTAIVDDRRIALYYSKNFEGYVDTCTLPTGNQEYLLYFCTMGVFFSSGPRRPEPEYLFRVYLLFSSFFLTLHLYRYQVSELRTQHTVQYL